MGGKDTRPSHHVQLDLVVIDFNNFTWSKREQASFFLTWVEENRKYFSYLYLLYCDSYYYCLKFIKEEVDRDKKYLGNK